MSLIFRRNNYCSNFVRLWQRYNLKNLPKTQIKRQLSCSVSVGGVNYNKIQNSTSNNTTFSSSTSPISTENSNSNESVEIQEKLKILLENERENYGIVPVFKKALTFGDKIAVKDTSGEYSYTQIYSAARKLSIRISQNCARGSSSRIIVLCPNNVTFIIAQWSCWMSGQIVVPVSPKHPKNLLEYYIRDSDSTLLLTTPEFETILTPISIEQKKPLIMIDDQIIDDDIKTNENLCYVNGEIVFDGILDTKFYSESNAMILYTSGTTADPKGVVISHKCLYSQLEGLQKSWEITQSDCLLHVLPLNHVHGCVNALLLPLYSGAKCIMLPAFDSSEVWRNLLHINSKAKDQITIFMAVPTIYNLLMDEYEKVFGNNKRMCDYIKAHCINKIRLMVSGSAPLTVSAFTNWFAITGHNLLERYGMTEIGMALSNPYIQDKNRKRIPGTVGHPLPNVEVRIVDPTTKKIFLEMKGEFNKGIWSKSEQVSYNPVDSKPLISGELLVRGPNVFTEYWGKPDVTKNEFSNGWFKTGDTVSFDQNSFRILGRTSADIIKSGGHKLSALQIENQLLEHPNIMDVAVVGLPDEVWGQRVAALIVSKDNEIMDPVGLKEFCLTSMAAYSIPSVFRFIEKIPRNQMGKVNKKELLRTVFK